MNNTYSILVTFLEHKDTAFLVMTPSGNKTCRVEIHYHDKSGNVQVPYKGQLSQADATSLVFDINLALEMDKR